MRASSGAVVALTLLLVLAERGDAQDTAAVVRHLLSLDISRVQPFRRTYDMIVHTRDSSVVLGRRDVVLTSAIYAGAPSWLLVETRSGLVPAVESLYVAPDMRPLHWSSTLGSARLGVEFVGDSLYGATTSPTGKQNIVIAGRPDLMVSASMTEMLLPLLPLTTGWTDSAAVLAVDLSSSAVVAAELAVVGEEDVTVDSLTLRPSWVVALRVGARHVLYWVEKETGTPRRIEQPLPAHAGTSLEYRYRPEAIMPSPPPAGHP